MVVIASPRVGRLPEPATALHGREEDIETTKGLLDSHRLVTLTGTGGSGKTRLAVAVASELRDDYADGVTFVALQDSRSRTAVAATIATAVGFRGLDIDDEQRLAAYLAEREMLLVLDNFEQVLTAATLVSSMLEAAPSIGVLVTSRAPLRISGEQEYEVLPLADDAAVALFVERARAVRAGFDPAEHSSEIASVTRRVDGLPLAVELAAAQTRMLTPAAILERLERQLPTLSTGQRDAPTRQRTQHAALEWSYQLLDEPGQHLFACLSVFAGGWTLDAAERVCRLIDGHEIDVFATLAALVEHSLVRIDGTDGSEQRYVMLQVTREYAADRLADSPYHAAIERRHAEWVRDLVETAEPELILRDLRTWQEQLKREEENLRTALRWAIDHGEAELGLRTAGSCWRFWHHWGEFQEGITWLESVIELANGDTPSEPRARALSALAGLFWHLGRGAESLRLYLEVIELLRALGDEEHLFKAVDDASWAAFLAGDADLARELTEEAWRYPRRRGCDASSSWGTRREVIAVREFAWHGKGSYEETMRIFERFLRDIQHSECALYAAHATLNMASMHLHSERADLALKRGQEAMRLYLDIGNVTQLTSALRLLANCELALGRPERAIRLAAASQREAAQHGGIVGSEGGPLARWEGTIEKARAQLSAERCATAVAVGHAMSLDEAVAFALSKASTRPGNAASRRRDPDALTPREFEVLELVTDGRTDTEIGEALFISPKTASAHVSNIKGKLRARSRAEIVAIALRGGLAG